MLGYSVSVPPYVRRALLSRSVDNDDFLPKLCKPVLITHGTDDAVVKSAVIDQHVHRISCARIRTLATGRACFFNPSSIGKSYRPYHRASPSRSTLHERPLDDRRAHRCIARS